MRLLSFSLPPSPILLPIFLVFDSVQSCIKTHPEDVMKVSTTSPTTTTPTYTCVPADWKLYVDSSGGSCYQITSTSSTWADANAQCMALSAEASLAESYSQDEYDWILDVGFYLSTATPWIGLFNTNAIVGDRVTGWMWLSGAPYTYQGPDYAGSWLSSAATPQGTGMRCVYFSLKYIEADPAFGWVDVLCTDSQQALCKQPAVTT